MIDPTPLQGLTGTATAALILSSEVGKKLTVPMAEQFGLIFGDVGAALRANIDKVLGKWTPLRNGKLLSAEEQLRALPLLLLASTQSDEELQSRWAALLDNTVTEASGVLPSFGQTLSQLTAGEARFLDRLFAFVTRPRNYLSGNRHGRDPIDYFTLIGVYDPSIKTAINVLERNLLGDKISKEQLEEYDRLTQAELIIQDLERLGIIARDQVAESERIPNSDFYSSPIGELRTVLRPEYSLTQYGVSFISAMTPKETP
jgi:hypothetical protein